MPGNKLGGVKASQRNKELYGEDFYRNIGKKGGLRKVPKGFALNRELAVQAGRLGGSVSRRTKK